jgi:hypothetical protein
VLAEVFMFDFSRIKIHVEAEDDIHAEKWIATVPTINTNSQSQLSAFKILFL